jgi:protein gp37
MATSKIEWTDVTWNPLAGCSVYSPGCKNCYAMKLAARLERMGMAKYQGLTDQTKAGAVWNGKINFDDDAMLQPLRWKKPRRIFVNSMSDLFHESVPDEWIDRIFTVMALAPQHTFQVLTKRSDRMKEHMTSDTLRSRLCSISRVDPLGLSGIKAEAAISSIRSSAWPLSNIWLGVSVEDQKHADERIPDLLATPAAVRFLSCEPLLGPIDLAWALSRNPAVIGLGFLRRGQFSPGLETLRPIDQVILGGESGPGARPMHPDWPRSIRDQCDDAGAAFFFKQWGKFSPSAGHDPQEHHCSHTPEAIHISGAREMRPSEQFHLIASRAEGWAGMCRIGKKAAGRLLDGVEYNGMPGEVR